MLAENGYFHFLKMKTVIVSGFDEYEYARQAIRFGIDEFLVKPLDIVE